MSELQPARPVVPAGWYPDPAGSGHQRWWDGFAWQQYAPAPQVVLVSRPKDMGISYLLWFFLGGLGVHQFYLGNVAQGIIQALLSIVGWSLAPIGLGFLLLVPLYIWLLADAFVIPNYVRRSTAIPTR